MNITKRKPVSVGEMITEEFLVPMSLTRCESKNRQRAVYQSSRHHRGYRVDAGHGLW
jgi:hypothetical protein